VVARLKNTAILSSTPTSKLCILHRGTHHVCAACALIRFPNEGRGESVLGSRREQRRKKVGVETGKGGGRNCNSSCRCKRTPLRDHWAECRPFHTASSPSVLPLTPSPRRDHARSNERSPRHAGQTPSRPVTFASLASTSGKFRRLVSKYVFQHTRSWARAACGSHCQSQPQGSHWAQCTTSKRAPQPPYIGAGGAAAGAVIARRQRSACPNLEV
jgi:hypothetical protein